MSLYEHEIVVCSVCAAAPSRSYLHMFFLHENPLLYFASSELCVAP